MNDVVIVKDTSHTIPQPNQKKKKNKYQGQTGGRSVHNFNELW